jgi:putative transposase
MPTTIRVDQGSQFTSKELDLWAYANGITLDFSRPGKPTDNAYVKRFNATVRPNASAGPGFGSGRRP